MKCFISINGQVKATLGALPQTPLYTARGAREAVRQSLTTSRAKADRFAGSVLSIKITVSTWASHRQTLRDFF